MNTIFNKQIDIAIANSRFDTHLQNKTLSWSEFIDKCKIPTKTNETIQEYYSFSKDKQANIKDVGGFVGGFLVDGKRSKDTVAYRTVIALDADENAGGCWNNFTNSYPSINAMIYSTHRHTPEAPRMRLIIPLNRNVSCEEYEAISRRIASDIGMEMFDASTFQPSRMMYWPSTSVDGEYVFEVSDGVFLDADEILSSYDDYTDESTWPRHTNEAVQLKRPFSEQMKINDITCNTSYSDPRKKTNIIGAFCTVYSVPKAIETFIPQCYSYQSKDRYTYNGSTTSGGLCVMENGLYAYSHHDHDPAKGKVLNAFDLVRIHLYGNLDYSVDDTSPIYKYPSYKEMVKLIENDNDVQAVFKNIKEDAEIALSNDRSLPVVETIYYQVKVLQPGVNSNYPLNDLGNGKLFAEVFKNDAVYCVERHSWYVYNGVIWEYDDESLKVSELCKRLAEAIVNYAYEVCCGDTKDLIYQKAQKWMRRSSRKTILDEAKSINLINYCEFDKDPNILNCKNGTLEFSKEVVFREHRASDFITKCCNADYIEEAKYPRFDRFICEIMSDDCPDFITYLIHDGRQKVEEKSDYLQRMFGYCLTGSAKKECFFILYGKTSRNGKGTLMNAVMNVMGDYGKNARPTTFAKNNTNSSAPNEDLARLASARIINVSEPDKFMSLNEAFMKSAVGNDILTARFLFEKSFEFRMTGKVIMNTNYLPSVSDMTIFKSNRIIVVPFEHHFAIEDQDTNLKDELQSEEAKSAILNWMIEGWKNQLTHGVNYKPKSIQNAINDYEKESDKIRQFVDEEMVYCKDGYVTTTEAYTKYQSWCETNGYHCENMKNFKAGMQLISVVDRKRRKGEVNKHWIILEYVLREPNCGILPFPNEAVS